MFRAGDQPQGRTALLLILLALILMVAAASYLMFARDVGPGPVSATEADSSGTPVNKIAVQSMFYKLLILLASVLLIMVFVIGSYLLIRVGRAVTGKPVGGKPTEYVDAWSSYRVTDDQIDMATRENGPRGADEDANPDNYEDDGPETDPRDPDA